jgi:hypothetical protein
MVPTQTTYVFFRCLAVHRGVVDVQDLETPAKTYYRQYLQQQDMTPADFKCVTLDDLVVLEQVFVIGSSIRVIPDFFWDVAAFVF